MNPAAIQTQRAVADSRSCSARPPKLFPPVRLSHGHVGVGQHPYGQRSRGSGAGRGFSKPTDGPVDSPTPPDFRISPPALEGRAHHAGANFCESLASGFRTSRDPSAALGRFFLCVEGWDLCWEGWNKNHICPTGTNLKAGPHDPKGPAVIVFGRISMAGKLSPCKMGVQTVPNQNEWVYNQPLTYSFGSKLQCQSGTESWS